MENALEGTTKCYDCIPPLPRQCGRGFSAYRARLPQVKRWKDLRPGVPATFPEDRQRDDVLRFEHLHQQLQRGKEVAFKNVTGHKVLRAQHDLSPRQIDVLLAGGLINWARGHAVSTQAQ